jgi:hypothetical protein
MKFWKADATENLIGRRGGADGTYYLSSRMTVGPAGSEGRTVDIEIGNADQVQELIDRLQTFKDRLVSEDQGVDRSGGGR